ncbi:MAG TPA: hypothetical protein VK210_02335, partial [Terriglobia bacterium]|nr:hypothetical protein [Terriglobia bacterium]
MKSIRLWVTALGCFGAIAVLGQAPAAPAAPQTGPGVQAPRDSKYQAYRAANCKNLPVAGAAAAGAPAAGGGNRAGGAAQGGAPPLPAAGGAPPAAGRGGGGGGGARAAAPTNPDGSPMHRDYKVAAIAGVIAEGATWKTVWTGRGNNADGPVATSDGGMMFAQNSDSKIMKLDKDGKVSFPYENTRTSGSVSINKKGTVFVLERALPQDVLQVAPKRQVLADKYKGEPFDCAGGLVNDMTSDSKGGVYFTMGGVFYSDAKGAVTKYGTIGGNGIILSPDEKTLYVTGRIAGVATVAADQPPSAAGGGNTGLVAFDVQPDGSLKNEHQFSTCLCGDGSAVDAQGRIYSTGGGGVQVLD